MSTKSTDRSTEVAGWMIATVLQQGVMIWAAIETTGVLSVALWSLVALGVVGVLIRAAQGHVADLKKKSARPTYGDVHVNLDYDAAKIAEAMARASRHLDGLDGTRR